MHIYTPFPEKTKAMDLAVKLVKDGTHTPQEAAKAHTLVYRSVLNRLTKERKKEEARDEGKRAASPMFLGLLGVHT